MQRSRLLVWLHVLIAWLPVWVLYAILIATAHPQVSAHAAALSAFLNHLEARLDSAKFVRIHRAHIVNLDHVKTFRTQARGRVMAEMIGGMELPVSRGRAQALRGLGA